MSSRAHLIIDMTGPMAVMGLGATVALILILVFWIDLNDPDDVAILPFEFRLCLGVWRFCCPRRMRHHTAFEHRRQSPDCVDDPSKCVPVGPLPTQEVAQDPI